MNENPYESPRPLAPTWLADDDGGGLWRDGDLLVARINNHRFPPRCLKTNEFYDGPPTRFEVHWVSHSLKWGLLFGLFGRAVARAIAGAVITLQLPLSQRWLAGRKRASQIGWSLIVGGMVSMVLAVVAYVFASLVHAITYATVWPVLFVLACPIISIGGVIYLAVRCGRMVSLRRVKDGHAWIGKVHPHFLASLPPWPG